MDEQALEAAELYALRNIALSAPDRDLSDLCDVEERIEAHLDELRMAGRSGARLAERTMREGPGQLFVAAVLAFESSNKHSIANVLDCTVEAPSRVDALVAALTWMTPDQVEPLCAELAATRSPSLRRAALTASTIHRIDPGVMLRTALVDADAALRAAALAAAGELGIVSLASAVDMELEADEPECRFSAASSAALLGNRDRAADVLVQMAESGGPWSERACRLAAGAISLERGHRWLAGLAGLGPSRLVPIAAASLGDPRIVPALVEWMDHEPIARLCGEAFTTITGIRIRGDLARPNQSRLRQLLPRLRYEPGVQYLLGQPRVGPWLRRVLLEGRQLERAEAARAEIIAQPGRPLFELRDRGIRQRARLVEAVDESASR